MSFDTISSEMHANWYDKQYADIDTRFNILDDWQKQKQENSINYWIHKRMFDLAHVLAQPATSWLTVGDGYGLDANYFKERGCKATASDISATFLEATKERNLIDEFSIQNVEKMTFEDNTFDYAFCKEAYHHFSRPMMGVYEMLRVSKKAIMFVEPQDPISRLPFLMGMRNILDNFNTKFLQKIWKNRYSFETVGNYVYKISEREIEKAAMGMNLPAVAFKGINNNYYSPKIINEKANNSSSIFRKIRLKLGLHNFLCKATIMPYQVLGAIMFKEMPTLQTIENLKKDGFRFYEFPKNPYLR